MKSKFVKCAVIFNNILDIIESLFVWVLIAICIRFCLGIPTVNVCGKYTENINGIQETGSYSISLDKNGINKKINIEHVEIVEDLK